MKYFSTDRKIYEPEQLFKLQTQAHWQGLFRLPKGAVAFVSETWGGCFRYNNLTKHSGILNKTLLGRRWHAY